MADLATLMAWRDALEKTLAQGVLTAEVDGERVTYQSAADIRVTPADIKQQIAALQGSGRRRAIPVNF